MIYGVSASPSGYPVASPYTPSAFVSWTRAHFFGRLPGAAAPRHVEFFLRTAGEYYRGMRNKMVALSRE